MALAAAWLVASCANVSEESLIPTDESVLTVVGAAATRAIVLDGATVSGELHVTLNARSNVSEVRFHLDGAASAIHVVREAPFEMYLDTTALEDGHHSITAKALSGASATPRVIATAAFVVANAPRDVEPDPGPNPGPEPTPEPSPVPDPEPSPVPDPGPPPYEGDLIVAPWGDDRAAGTLGAPLRTLTEAADRARPGDVILLRGGTYDAVEQDAYVTIEIDGAPDAPITIAAYPGEHPIIDGGRHPYHPRTFGDGRNVTSPALLILIGDHLIVEDLTFEASVGRGLFLHGDDNVLRRVTSHDHHSDGIHLRGSRNLLEDVVSHSNVSVANGGDSADGIKIMNPTTAGAPVNRDNVIRRAVLHHNSDDGLDIWDSVGTTIEYTVSYANGVGPSGNGNGFKLGCRCAFDNQATIRSSIAFGNRGNNFDSNGAGGITLIQNTSWSAGSHGFVLRNTSGTSFANVAYNNISFQDVKTNVADAYTQQAHNTWNLGIDDPRFASLDPTTTLFLTLRSTSPAIDAGIQLDPGDPAPDLGALPHEEVFAGLP